MDDNIFKIAAAAVSAFFTYTIWGIQKNNSKHERHDVRINEHDQKLTVVEQQVKHILEKMDDILQMGDDLKQSNKTILRALARKTKG